jgi:hypothetical protein
MLGGQNKPATKYLTSAFTSMIRWHGASFSVEEVHLLSRTNVVIGSEFPTQHGEDCPSLRKAEKYRTSHENASLKKLLTGQQPARYLLAAYALGKLCRRRTSRTMTMIRRALVVA